MEKWIKFLVLLFSLITSWTYAQEDEKVNHKATIIRNITLDNKVESYIEIRDSALAVIDLLKEKWGEAEEQKGEIKWSNVLIDSIEGKVNIILLHGMMKEGSYSFKICSTFKKEKDNEVRILRLRMLQKDKDILSSAVTSAIVINFVNEIIRQVFQSDDTNHIED